MKQRQTESENQGGKWLLTFNDMVTLLLTFFVLILSLSKLDAPKLGKAASSMRAIFNLSEQGVQEKVEVFTPFVLPLGSDMPRRNSIVAFEKKQFSLVERINEKARHIAAVGRGGESSVPGEDLLSWERVMEARVAEEGVAVSLGEQLLFETGSAKIAGKRQPALDAPCSILREMDCRIRVEGNTDEVPINTEQFPSNWELSVARAVSVVRYCISRGAVLPERLSAAGYADFRPRVPALNERNRGLNRRVEILVILSGNEGGRKNG